MIPLKLFPPILSFINCWNFPKHGGMFPSNLFFDRPNKYREVKLQKEEGCRRDNLLPPKYRPSNFWSFPKSFGMIPEKEFISRPNPYRFVKLPRPTGIVPTMLYATVRTLNSNVLLSWFYYFYFLKNMLNYFFIANFKFKNSVWEFYPSK